MNKKNLFIAAAVTLVLAAAIIAYKAKTKKADTDDTSKTSAVNPLEGKTIYNPDIQETEGRIWTLIDGKWYAPLSSANWGALPAKREQMILAKTAYTKEDFLKYPKAGTIDYTTLAQFK